MDYINMPQENPIPKPNSKAKKKQKQDTFDMGYGWGDIGLDLSGGLNLGLDLKQGISDKYSGIDNPSWGFEDYVARDFAAPKAFKLYGKESKKDRKFRTVGSDDEIIYGLESLETAIPKSSANISKASKEIKSTIEYKRLQRRLKDKRNRMEFAERKTKSDMDEPIKPETSEHHGFGNYGMEEQMLVAKRKPKKGRLYTKYLGQRQGRHYFAQSTYEGYSPYGY